MDVVRLDDPVGAAVEHRRLAAVADLHAQLEWIGRLAGALPRLHRDLRLHAILRQEDAEAIALEPPLEELDEVPPLRRLADATHAALLVIDQDEVADHVALVGGKALDPNAVHRMLRARGVTVVVRNCTLQRRDAEDARARHCEAEQNPSGLVLGHGPTVPLSDLLALS